MPSDSDPTEFRELMQQVAIGSDAAIEKLLREFGPHVLMAVRRRFHRSLAAQFDSADFAQAVWASFFGGIRNASEFNGPKELVAYLTAIARNKVVDQVRRRMNTQKRNAAIEIHLDSHGVDGPRDVAARIPTPSQAAIANEKWEELMRQLPGRHQRILYLRLQGLTHLEIARQTEASPRTVRRLLRLLANVADTPPTA